MRHAISTSHTRAAARSLSRRIRTRLPLATIEELDHLAGLAHTTRQQILRHIITAALVSDTPFSPAGPDPTGRLIVHAHLTHARSLELAHEA